MHSTAIIRNGDLLLSKDLRDFIAKNPESECDIEIHIINKPAHYLYKYLHGYLIADIVNHSGIDEDEVIKLMKSKFATVEITDLNEIPHRHRGKRTQIVAFVDSNNEIKYYNWIKSCSYMTHEELKEYVVNVEKHFMGFMEGALDIKKQLEANKFRKIGMMNNKEFKNYLKNMEGDSIV